MLSPSLQSDSFVFPSLLFFPGEVRMSEAPETGVGRTGGRGKRGLLSSLPLGVETFAKAVRSHWGVENQCHWMLDVIYRENESRARTGHNAENLCTTRALALTLCLEPTNKPAGRNKSYLEKVLKI